MHDHQIPRADTISRVKCTMCQGTKPTSPEDLITVRTSSCTSVFGLPALSAPVSYSPLHVHWLLPATSVIR